MIFKLAGWPSACPAQSALPIVLEPEGWDIIHYFDLQLLQPRNHTAGTLYSYCCRLNLWAVDANSASSLCLH